MLSTLLNKWSDVYGFIMFGGPVVMYEVVQYLSWTGTCMIEHINLEGIWDKQWHENNW